MILNTANKQSQHKFLRFSKTRTAMLTLLLVSAILMSLIVSLNSVDCAPASNSNNKNGNNKTPRPSLLSQLFRRQTSSSSSNENNGSSSSPSSSSSSSDNDEQLTQTELDAQKFMDSLPNVGPPAGPSTFRERMSDTFGLLRDGVNNHFRSFRENWSDTMEDLRDTWSNSNSE